MEIRSEQPRDHQVIHRLTTDAFASMSFSDGTEPAIIDNLRAAGDLTLSLVAVKDGVVVGHVAFSPVIIGSLTNGWYGLGPISVWPQQQRKGIGSALINEGLRTLHEMGADGCVLIGDPEYYCRFGFVSDESVQYGNLPSRNVQWLSFSGQRPKGQIVFRAAFGN